MCLFSILQFLPLSLLYSSQAIRLCGLSYLCFGCIPSASSSRLTTFPCTVHILSLTDLWVHLLLTSCGRLPLFYCPLVVLCLSLTPSSNWQTLFFIFWSHISSMCFIWKGLNQWFPCQCLSPYMYTHTHPLSLSLT